MPELALTMIGQQSLPSETSELALLVSRAKAGDVSAFEQILIQFERRVFRAALRMLGSVEDAQDAAQEVFLKLHKHLRRFDDERAFTPWLYRVTVNVCRDIAARRRRNQGVSLELTEVAAAAQDVPDRTEERRIVGLALKRLPEKERAAVVLRDIEGLATAEVARILGSSEATVRSQVSSARLKIKQFADNYSGRRV